MKNIAESIRYRLKTQARSLGIAPDSVFSHWGMERFLNRFAHSPYRDRFALKGALLFAAWHGDWRRSTTDIDLEGLDDSYVGRMSEVVGAVAALPSSEPDGMAFDASSVRSQPLVGDRIPGARVVVTARLGASTIHLKVDTGFGHPITPAPETIEYPCMLAGFSAFALLGCPRETMLAEKLATIVEFGRDNTRVRDYHDITALADRNRFDSKVLIRAARETFSRRDAGRFLTRTDGYWEAGLSSELARERFRRAWENRRRRMPRTHSGRQEMAAVMGRVKEFGMPLLKAVRDGEASIGRWDPEDGWIRRSSRAPEVQAPTT